MPRVNLIPQEIKHQQGRQSRMRIWMGIVIVVALVVTTVSVVTYLVGLRVDRQYRQTYSQYHQVDARLKKISSTESQLAGLQDRLAVLRELGQYPDLLEITGYLTGRTPGQIYLSEIDFCRLDEDSDEGLAAMPNPVLPKMAGMFRLKPGIKAAAAPASASGQSDAGVSEESLQMVLRGHGPAHLVVAEYLNVLKVSGFFDKIGLAHSTRRSQGPDAIIDFEIECSVRKTVPHLSAEGYYADQQKTNSL